MKMKKVLVAVMAAIIMSGLVRFDVFAADKVNVAFSGAQTTVGKEVEVNVSLSGNSETIAVTQLRITYDPTILEVVSTDGVNGGGGQILILSEEGKTAYTIKFKAIAAGTSGVTLNTSESIIASLQTDKMEMNVVGANIVVKGAVTQSKNNDLKSLTVSPGTLTPAFSKDVTTYNMTLDKYVNRLTVSAATDDAKAKVSVWGAAMDPGDNTTKITVTAENGDQKVYTIYTKVPEKEEEKKAEILIEVEGGMYNVISNFDESIIPEGYEVIDYTYKKNKIIAAKGISNGKIIFCIADAASQNPTQRFALYNEVDGSFEMLRVIIRDNMTYTVLESFDTSLIPEGFVETTQQIDGVDYKVWVNSKETNPEYFIIYCSNISGVDGWYQYDMLEGTIQRAFLSGKVQDTPKEEAPVQENVSTDSKNSMPMEDYLNLQKEYDDYKAKSKMVLGMLAFLLVAIIIIIIICLLKSYRNSHDEYEEYEGEEDEDDEDEEEIQDDDSSDDDVTFLN